MYRRSSYGSLGNSFSERPYEALICGTIVGQRRRESRNEKEQIMAVNRETVSKCREQYGESHDAHMAVNGECPWCGTYDEAQGGMSVEMAEEVFG